MSCPKVCTAGKSSNRWTRVIACQNQRTIHCQTAFTGSCSSAGTPRRRSGRPLNSSTTTSSPSTSQVKFLISNRQRTDTWPKCKIMWCRMGHHTRCISTAVPWNYTVFIVEDPGNIAETRNERIFFPRTRRNKNLSPLFWYAQENEETKKKKKKNEKKIPENRQFVLSHRNLGVRETTSSAVSARRNIIRNICAIEYL